MRRGKSGIRCQRKEGFTPVGSKYLFTYKSRGVGTKFFKKDTRGLICRVYIAGVNRSSNMKRRKRPRGKRKGHHERGMGIYHGWELSGRVIRLYLYLNTCCESTEDIHHQGSPQWLKFSIDRALDLCTSRSTDASRIFHSHPALSDSI